MKNPLLPVVLAIALPTVFLLSACDPTPIGSPGSSSTPNGSDSASPSGAPSQAPSAAPVNVNSDDYLVEHFPAADDSNEYWHWAFWTDASKAVRCDLSTGGTADPLTTCWVMPGFEASTTYALPAGTPPPNCAGGDVAPQLDGYSLQLVIEANPAYQNASILGCPTDRSYLPPGVGAATHVLPNHATLTTPDFTCTVVDAVATCTYPAAHASVTLGLSAIGVTN